MKRSITKSGLALSDVTDQLVNKFIGTGVRRMETGRVLDREDKVRLAEDNLRRLVRKMVQEATNLRTFPIIEAKAFDNAVRALCPIWPFC